MRPSRRSGRETHRRADGLPVAARHVVDDRIEIDVRRCSGWSPCRSPDPTAGDAVPSSRALPLRGRRMPRSTGGRAGSTRHAGSATSPPSDAQHAAMDHRTNVLVVARGRIVMGLAMLLVPGVMLRVLFGRHASTPTGAGPGAHVRRARARARRRHGHVGEGAHAGRGVGRARARSPTRSTAW